MKIDLSNFKTGKVFKIKNPDIIHRSDFHKLTSKSEIKLVEITNPDQELAGFYLIGDFNFVADMIIHSKFGAQGRVIEREMKDVILLTKEEKIEQEMEHVADNEENSIKEFVHNKIKDTQLKYINIGLNMEFSFKPQKYSLLIDVDNPAFVILQKESKIILANGYEVIIRKGDKKVVEITEENGIAVHKPKKSIDIINGELRINKMPIADFIRNKTKKKMKFKIGE